MSLAPARPHLLGLDDGAFDRHRDTTVPVIAVTMEGAALVEHIACTTFPVDGDDATGVLSDWIRSLRVHPCLHAVLLGGITIAGLGLIDLEAFAERLGCPVIAVNRKPRENAPLLAALRAAGLDDRRAIVDHTPTARAGPCELSVATAGVDDATADALIEASVAKGRWPEPLRVAHMVASAVARGESYGRA